MRRPSHLLLLACALPVLAALGVASLGDYYFLDDYLFLWAKGLKPLEDWLSIGRPLTYLYLLFIQKSLPWTPAGARWVSLALLLLVVVGLRRVLDKPGTDPVAVHALALLPLTLYQTAVSVVWVNTGSTALALLLATAAYHFMTQGRTGPTLLGLALLTLAFLTYQPAACLFFALLLLGVLLEGRAGPTRREVLLFLGGAASVVTAFLFTRVPPLLGYHSGWAGRSKLLENPGAKLQWLYSEVLPVASVPYFPPPPYVSALVGGLILFALVAGLIKGRAHGGEVLARSPLVFLLWALACLGATYLPNLVVEENFASARSMVALAYGLMGMAALGLNALVERAGLRTSSRFVLVLAPLVVLGLLNVQQVFRQIVQVQKREVECVKADLVEGLARGQERFVLVTPLVQPVTRSYHTYEFGWMSSSVPWGSTGLLRFSAALLGRNPDELSLTIASEPTRAEGHPIDMRPCWQSLAQELGASAGP